MSGIAERVIAIVAAQALRDPAAITPESTPEEIGLDSLGLVEAIFAIEEAFDISVPFNPNEASETGGEGFERLADLIALVEDLVARTGR